MLKTDTEKEMDQQTTDKFCAVSYDRAAAGDAGKEVGGKGGEDVMRIKAKRTDSKSEIEALQQIYEEICAIRRRHAELMAETAARKGENQRQLDAEKAKYDELEAQHRETGRQMKNLTSGSDEQKSAMVKYRVEQEELENQRKLLDDLEFEMLETDAHYDEQKESIQQQLMMEQKMLSDIERRHSTRPSISDEMNSPDLLCPAICITQCNCDSDRPCSCDSNDKAKSSLPTVSTESCSSSSLELQPQDQLFICERTDLVTDDKSSVERHSDETTAHHGAPAIDLNSNQTNRSVEPPSSSSFNASNDRSLDFDSDDWSTTSSERQLDKETDVNERIREMQRMLVSAEAEKARLLQQPTEEINSPEKSDNRTKRLQFEEGILSDTASQESDHIIRRKNVRSQARPLTRYLPVRDENLDLLAFVEQAGHYVQLCAGDITVTSESARGFLVKMGGRIRTWRKRWFVFDRTRRHLAYFTSNLSELKKPRGCIKFCAIQDVFVFDQSSSIKTPSPELTFCVKTSRRTYYIVAPSNESKQLWMEIIFTGAEGYREFTMDD